MISFLDSDDVYLPGKLGFIVSLAPEARESLGARPEVAREHLDRDVASQSRVALQSSTTPPNSSVRCSIAGYGKQLRPFPSDAKSPSAPACSMKH